MNILFVSLGCDKNLVDSEMMLGLLAKKGYDFTDNETEADVIVVNTCCFIGDAKEESVNTLLEMSEYRKSGRCRALIVTGCLAERYRQEILDEIPEVDAVLGTASYDSITEAVEQALGGRHMLRCEDTGRLVLPDAKRILTTGGHYAHLKIAEGCDKHCTYCIIPYARGRVRSRDMQDVAEEVRRLAEKGYREVVLTGIHLSSYGIDFDGQRHLLDLIRVVHETEGIMRIRLGSLEPGIVTDEFAKALASMPKLCPHFHLSLQRGRRRQQRPCLCVRQLQFLHRHQNVLPDRIFVGMV